MKDHSVDIRSPARAAVETTYPKSHRAILVFQRTSIPRGLEPQDPLIKIPMVLTKVRPLAQRPGKRPLFRRLFP
jgi:hypothetical protein